MSILPAVDKIFGDEKAIALYEIHEQSPNFRGFHRYQIIQVPRNGVICEWRKDMGNADNFRGISQLRIPSYMEHTVDELKAIANELRTHQFDIKGYLELNKYIPG
jgi:hypothetical protein